jgi:hypothetical protein
MSPDTRRCFPSRIRPAADEHRQGIPSTDAKLADGVHGLPDAGGCADISYRHGTKIIADTSLSWKDIMAKSASLKNVHRAAYPRVYDLMSYRRSLVREKTAPKGLVIAIGVSMPLWAAIIALVHLL